VVGSFSWNRFICVLWWNWYFQTVCWCVWQLSLKLLIQRCVITWWRS